MATEDPTEVSGSAKGATLLQTQLERTRRELGRDDLDLRTPREKKPTGGQVCPAPARAPALLEALRFIDERGGLRIPTFPDWLRDLYAMFPLRGETDRLEVALPWRPEWFDGVPDVDDWVHILWIQAIGAKAKRELNPQEARRRTAERYAARWRVVHGPKDGEGVRVWQELSRRAEEQGCTCGEVKILAMEAGICLAGADWERRRRIRVGARGRGRLMRPGGLPGPLDAFPEEPPYLQLFKAAAIAWLLDAPWPPEDGLDADELEPLREVADPQAAHPAQHIYLTRGFNTLRGRFRREADVLELTARGYSDTEISARLSCTKGAVRTARSKGRKHLREILK